MPPLDQGPDLPAETAEQEAVMRERDKEERGRNKMRDEDRRNGNRRVEGCEGNAFSLVKCDCHTLLYI